MKNAWRQIGNVILIGAIPVVLFWFAVLLGFWLYPYDVDRASSLVMTFPPSYQYWTPSSYAEMFIPDKDDAVDKLKYAVENYNGLMEKFKPAMKKTVDQYTWENVADKIISLME